MKEISNRKYPLASGTKIFKPQRPPIKGPKYPILDSEMLDEHFTCEKTKTEISPQFQ